jgi:hypothetical protein
VGKSICKEGELRGREVGNQSEIKVVEVRKIYMTVRVEGVGCLFGKYRWSFR